MRKNWAQGTLVHLRWWKEIEEVSCKLALPPSLEGIHNIFHISQLWKYIPDSSHIIDYLELDLQPDLSYMEQLIAIMDRGVKTLKNNIIPLVLVSWNRSTLGEATWEREDVIRERYPYLSHLDGNFLLLVNP